MSVCVEEADMLKKNPERIKQQKQKQIRMGTKQIRTDLKFASQQGISLPMVETELNLLLEEVTTCLDLSRLNQLQQNLFRLGEVVVSEIVRSTKAAKQQAIENQNLEKELNLVQPRIRVIKLISSNGSFGKVYLVRRDDKDYALKVAVRTNIPEIEQEVMEQLGNNHPNLMGAHETFVLSDNRICILMSLAGMELFDFLSLRPMPTEPQHAIPSELMEILLSVSNGVAYLHENGIAHRDIKLENVLRTLDKDAKKPWVIIDFGMATREKLSYLRCGSPNYVAPEVMRSTPYVPFKADIWSLGVLFYATLMTDFPYDYSSQLPVIMAHIKYNLSKVRGIYGPRMSELLSNMLTIDADKRLTINQVCDNLAQF